MLDLKAYLNRLASAEPTPGGGSAATIVGALGAALIGMVARITLGSQKHLGVHAEALLLVESADTLRSQFVAARPHDEAAYAAVVAAQTLPRDSDAARTARSAQLMAALHAATEAPLRVAALCAELLDAGERTAALGNAHLASDVEGAVAFGRAALEASAANVRINHHFMHDAQQIAAQAQRLDAIVHAARASERRAQAILAAG